MTTLLIWGWRDGRPRPSPPARPSGNARAVRNAASARRGRAGAVVWWTTAPLAMACPSTSSGQTGIVRSAGDGEMSKAGKTVAPILVAAGAALFAGCADRTLPTDTETATPRSGTPTALPVGWVSYASDGTLIVASRTRVIRLDRALNEIDRTVPPFPFDPKATPPGAQFFSVSSDGRVAAISWQSDSHEEPVMLRSGAIVFDVPSAALFRSDTYPGIDVQFQGLSLSPDGQSTASVDNAGNVQVADVAGGLRWQGFSLYVHPPVFTADSSMLILAP